MLGADTATHLLIDEHPRKNVPAKAFFREKVLVIALALKTSIFLPRFERAILKEILINPEEHSVLLRMHAQATCERVFRKALLDSVVRRIVDASYRVWMSLFVDCATERGKALANVARERRNREVGGCEAHLLS